MTPYLAHEQRAAAFCSCKSPQLVMAGDPRKHAKTCQVYQRWQVAKVNVKLGIRKRDEPLGFARHPKRPGILYPIIVQNNRRNVQ